MDGQDKRRRIGISLREDEKQGILKKRNIRTHEFFKETIEKHPRLVNILLIISFFLLGISFGMLVMYFITKPTLETESYEETQVYTEGLTIKEKANVNKILQTLKPIYFKAQREITFSKNITTTCKERSIFLFKEDKCDKLLGFNQWGKGGIMFIEYTNDNQELMRRLCHEIIHTFALPDENTHQIVYDIGDSYLCFQDEYNPLLNRGKK